MQDDTKIGMGLMAAGAGFFFLGVMMFMDPPLLGIGNLMFVTGTVMTMGYKRAWNFFRAPKRRRTVAMFLLGIALVLCRWIYVGILVESYGGFLVFRDFIPAVIGYLRNVPVLGAVFNLPGIRGVTRYLQRLPGP